MRLKGTVGLDSSSHHGESGAEESNTRFLSSKLVNKRVPSNSKSYLKNRNMDQKYVSGHRRAVIKSSLFSVLRGDGDDDDDDDDSNSSFADGEDTPLSSSEQRKDPRKLTRSKSLDADQITTRRPRSKSIDGKKSLKKDQSKRRGKKAETLSGNSKPHSEKGFTVMDHSIKLPERAASSKGRGRMRSLAVDGAQPGSEKNALHRNKSDRQVKSNDSSRGPPPRRRRSSLLGGIFNGGSKSTSSDHGDSYNHKLGVSKQRRRSLSLGRGKKRGDYVGKPLTSPARSRISVDDTSRQGSSKKEVELGAFLHDDADTRIQRNKREEEKDSNDDGSKSATSEQSWIAWAAATTLGPLEKLYDEMNGAEGDSEANSD